MSGIVGIVGAREPVEARVIVAMRDRLAHRGPDDAGIAFSRDGHTAFGHRRLAIVDPSPGGHQPMQNRSRTLLVTCDGLVSNFREIGTELARAGYVFTTRSDTEVLLAAFEHCGLDAVERLRGTFAFAMWSEEMHECVLVRDRLGLKPLSYAVVGSTLYFASEATALHVIPELHKDLDPAGLGDYLAYGYVPGGRSIWRGVQKLVPGHFLVFSGGEPILRRYWTPPPSPDPRTPADRDTLRSALEEAVRQASVADTPVAALLSGGLASSTVAALMPAGGEPTSSYTIDFDDRAPEATPGRLVAEHLKTDHHERRLSRDLSPAALSRVIAAFDEPIGDASIVAAYLIAEEVARDMKVVLADDGGDEIFAGSPAYARFERSEKMRRQLGPLARPLARLAAHLPQGRSAVAMLARRLELLGGPALENSFRQAGYFDGPARAALADPALTQHMADDALWLFRAHWRPELPLIRRLQFLDLHTNLADSILPTVDRAGMHHSLETRLPLLDHRLVELALRLPLDAMYGQKTGKLLLREVARDLLPRTLADRPSAADAAVPRTQWVWSGPGAYQAERLRNGVLIGRGLVQPAALETLLAQPALGRNPCRLWLLLVLDLWLEVHFA